MKRFGAQNMVSPLKKVLMKKPQPFMSKVDLKKWNYFGPLDQHVIDKNYNDFLSYHPSHMLRTIFQLIHYQINL